MDSLSIIIPAYNEQQRLPATLVTVAAFLDTLAPAFAEVLVVNDGSRDQTAQVVRDFATRDPRVRLLENPGNRGKGYAVRHGMQKAQGDWILFSDADLSAPIDELNKLWAAVQSRKADGAIGSRALDRSLIGVRQSAFRETSGKFFNLVMRLITGLPYRDTQCGFKLFSRPAAAAVAARQRIEGFGFDVEILFIAKKHQFRILEVPVRWNNVEGTKVSLWNGLQAFLDPLEVRRNDLRGLYR
ncbi:MAG: glycosyltransferase family 2 protein [Bryobacteraceae bacterium]|nr:glycosyltransferase family 2 protein [Solibacteraceae bacterium]MCO5349485.1 glycosyltransferase family 2 protein [Bryobacteraceae bacterium]